jgi:hypothetical protein
VNEHLQDWGIAFLNQQQTLHRVEDWKNGSGSFCACEVVSDCVTPSDSLRTNACAEGLSIWSEAVVISFQPHLLFLFLRLG